MLPVSIDEDISCSQIWPNILYVYVSKTSSASMWSLFIDEKWSVPLSSGLPLCRTEVWGYILSDGANKLCVHGVEQGSPSYAWRQNAGKTQQPARPIKEASLLSNR